MQLILNNPEAFDSTLAHYGSFENVQNHIALIGPAGGDLEERCGYYGERVVLLAQSLGLNTCWVALTYKRKTVQLKSHQGKIRVMYCDWLRQNAGRSSQN